MENKKRPPSPLELKRAEMMKHYDSHYFLTTKHFTWFNRPILIDYPLQDGTDFILDNAMTAAVAAQADEKSILIMDMNTARHLNITSSRIHYVVNDSSVPGTYLEPGDVQYPRQVIGVASVEAALLDIIEKMTAVTAQANPKTPYGLPNSLWPYMAAREIRIIGNFRMISKALELADMVVQHRPDHHVKTVFATKSLGKRVFDSSNLTLVMKAYSLGIDLAEKLHREKTPTLSPYMDLALKNMGDVEPNINLGVEVIHHHKNEHSDYHIGKNIPNTTEDLLIVDPEQWREWIAEGKDQAFAMVVSADTSLLKDPTIVDSGKVLTISKSRYAALKFVLEVLKIVVEQPGVELPIKLDGIKKIHVFNDIISDAYGKN